MSGWFEARLKNTKQSQIISGRGEKSECQSCIFLGQGCRFGPKNRSRQTLDLPIFRSGLVPSVATSCQKFEELHALRVDLGMALKKVTPFLDGFLSGYPNMENVRVQKNGGKNHPKVR